MKSAILVFAKRPVPGAVKTRLTALLTEEEAAGLYEAFLRDALKQYTALDADVRLYLGPPADLHSFDLAPAGVVVREQQGAGLGERMKRAFVESFAAGYERLVVIGTDHPSLPTGFIEQAFAALSEPGSICIGPCDDGGFYLMGMNDFYPQLFTDMEYSHEQVFTQTLLRVGTTNATLTILPAWYDVDTPDTLKRLVADLKNPALDASNTQPVVARLVSRYPSLKT
ncbi:MAG: TIGR04282 family arsenosugar biosynthesis glycosyltransferase [Rhodothermales bacterium]